jgi:hypothetical protein
VIVIVQNNQVTETQVASKTACLSRNSLLETTVAANHVGLAGDDVGEVRRVVVGAKVLGGDGHADGVGDSLSKRASTNLHSYEEQQTTCVEVICQ